MLPSQEGGGENTDQLAYTQARLVSQAQNLTDTVLKCIFWGSSLRSHPQNQNMPCQVGSGGRITVDTAGLLESARLAEASNASAAGGGTMGTE